MLSLLFAALLQAAGPPPPPAGPDCPGPQALTPTLQLTLALQKNGDLETAKAQLDPLVVACDARSLQGIVVRVLRAELAAGEKDWPGVRRALDGLTLERPVPLAVRAAFLRLQAEKEEGDVAAVQRHRDALLAANAAGLAARGRQVESFAAGPYTVTAFEAVVDQGPFRRLIEFVGAPSDAAGFPVTVTITDDLNASRVAAEMAAKEGKPAPRIFFTDLYTCAGHRTLAPPPLGPDGGAPTYAQVRPLVAKVFEDLAKAPVSSSGSYAGAGCPSAAWIVPGLTPPRPPVTPAKPGG